MDYTPEQLRERIAKVTAVFSKAVVPDQYYEAIVFLLGVASAHADKIEECERLKGVLKYWASDGRLQTFPDRERFRAEAHAALKETK
jgi:hypothetical protein